VTNYFTVVFNGSVLHLQENPLFIQSKFGFPERITDGDVISEVEELIDMRNQLLRVLKKCRKVLDDLPISAHGMANVDGVMGEVDRAIFEAKKSNV